MTLPEVLPPDVETKVVALRNLPAASQVSAITAMLAHSKAGLLTAIAAQDLPSIVEWKAKAAAIQEMTKQLQLGKDMQLDAAEFIRRAERGLGVAIREGQSRGEIKTRTDGGSGVHVPGVSGSLPRCHEHLGSADLRPSPKDYASKHELSNTHGGIYDITDDIPDNVFEEVLSEAKAEENLSRANVTRKALGKIGKSKLINPKQPKIGKKTARARKTIEHIATTMNSLAFVLSDLDPAEVDSKNMQSTIQQIYTDIAEIKGFLQKVNHDQN